MSFDWNRTIENNRIALAQVIEEIYALLDFVLGGAAKNLPLALQQAAYRLLVPAESALRRLILIAARGLKVEVPQAVPEANWQGFVRKGSRALSFQLYDTRKRFFRKRHVKSQSPTPRISFFNGSGLVTIAAPKRAKPLTSHRIFRRFATFKRALENIPREAKRMALWQARQAHKAEAKFRNPMRPGAPPGARRKLPLRIDVILQECHSLAMAALREAPS